MTEILAKVIRGETVESVHRGHLAIVDGEGRKVAAIGDPEIITFIRSAAKPFQVLPFLLKGADELGFREPEIALACGSHSGEEIHTAMVEKMLRKAGFSAGDLVCGEHLPFNEKRAEEMLAAGEKPTQLHNNCSGKHAAMLAFAKFIGADVRSYHRLENPVQQEILAAMAAFADIPKERIAIGIDGCAVPNFALPLAAMAKSFAKLVCPPPGLDERLRAACRRIVTVMISYPELIGGEKRLDTILMQAARGRIVSKIGAEGVWLCGVLPSEKWPQGLGVALKIEDGEDQRARPVVAIEILRQLRLLDQTDLGEYSPLPIKSRRGDVVGRVEANFVLAVNGAINTNDQL